MSYTILSARWGNAAHDAVVLQTIESGEVHLDPAPIPEADRAKGRQHHNEAALAAYKAWLAAGNTPAPFEPPPAPAAPRDIAAELDALKERNAKLEAALAAKSLVTKAEIDAAHEASK